MVITYSVEEVTPYLNWVYFLHAWGFKIKETDSTKIAEAKQLQKDAQAVLLQLKNDWKVQSLFRLCEVNAIEDDLWIEGVRIPLLRQQSPASPEAPCLCLSDFIRPQTSGIPDCIGLFASTVSLPNEACYQESDPYLHLLIQTLSDRLAEAATEKMHEYVRKTAWGYAADEQLSIPDLLVEKFQGIRPAVGYPSLPDQSINFLLDKLLDMKQIGITLTENGAMYPHASVSGFMIAHPASHYFSIGPVGHDQLKDYAARRGYTMEEMQKFLQV